MNEMMEILNPFGNTIYTAVNYEPIVQFQTNSGEYYVEASAS